MDSRFLTPLDYRKVDAHKWQLLAPLVYERKGEHFIVPSGFVTNGPSIPRAFYVTTPPIGEYDKAAVLHDFLYSGAVDISRSEADSIFLEAMRVCGVGWYTRTKMYLAVRLFGNKHFKGLT